MESTKELREIIRIAVLENENRVVGKAELDGKVIESGLLIINDMLHEYTDMVKEGALVSADVCEALKKLQVVIEEVGLE